MVRKIRNKWIRRKMEERKRFKQSKTSEHMNKHMTEEADYPIYYAEDE